MAIIDLCRAEAGLDLDTDVCVVGSGPAGLTLARELMHTRARVLVVESGGLVAEPESEALSEIENVGRRRQMDQTHVRNRVLGGSSHTWSGRCTPLDDIDFAERAWVPDSGWPISRAELEPYYDRAAPFLGVSRSRYPAGARPAAGMDPSVLAPASWQFSQHDGAPQDFMRFGPAFLAARRPNVSVLVHATATHVTTDPGGNRLECLEVASPDGKRATIRTRVLVLAQGGIETPRLLLCSNRVLPDGVGNGHGLVGRFLMDHPRCMMAEMDVAHAPAVRPRFGPYKVANDRGRHVFLDGLALSPEYQRRHELLNCSAWLHEERAEDNPLDAAKRLATRPRRQVGRDAWAVVSQLPLLYRGLHDRFVLDRAVTHKLRHLGLMCMVEQRPDPDSRLTLGTAKDRFGMPLPRLDWRVHRQELDSLAALGREVTAQFERVGLPPVRVADWLRHGRYDEANIDEAAHPIGTTRMASDPRRGVVDGNCQVHGLADVFVAGSSVFPTGGHANPTLTVVALAIRLADRVKERLAR